ncbi:hypothetical protein BEN74_02090 [Acinetobacter sp. WCHAc010034]|nr:hypothetical protein BEN74_02090 [Acinetobacter sp. WCHAc010034]
MNMTTIAKILKSVLQHIALNFSRVNYFGNFNDDACTASFFFKSFNGFAQARFYFGKTQRYRLRGQEDY